MASLLIEKPAWAKGNAVSLFKLPVESFVSSLLSSLPDAQEDKNEAPVATTFSDESAARLTCLACGLTFGSRQDQVLHFKSDSHRICLQQRLSGDTRAAGIAVDERSRNPEDENDDDDQEDEGEEEEDGDDKEDGGDDEVCSSESGGQNWWLRTGHPTVVVAGPTSEGFLPWGVGLPVALVAQSRKDIRYGGAATVAAGLQALQQCGHAGATWAVLTLRSGRFAGGIFQGDALLLHKCFKRYTVRKGQGGSQATMDGTGKAPKSVGASLRREGEIRLREEVRDLLRSSEWRPALATCSFLFVSCPRTLLPVLFGSNSTKDPAPLRREDPRLRTAASAAKPSLAEVKAIHASLSSVDVFHDLNALRAQEPKASSISQPRSSVAGGSLRWPSTAAEAASSAAATVAGGREEPVVIDPGPAFYQACVAGDAIALTAALSSTQHDELEGSCCSDLEVRPDPNSSQTALHVACGLQRADLVTCLLEAGANPAALDSHQRPPYFLASAKDVRDAFRLYRASPGAEAKWDWEAARVPDALTDEVLAKKKEKEREKKRRAREREKERKAEAAAEKAKADAAAAEAAAAAAVAEAAEQEAIRKGSICDACAGGIKGGASAALRRLDFKYCSSLCVQNHRRALQAEAAERRMK